MLFKCNILIFAEIVELQAYSPECSEYVLVGDVSSEEQRLLIQDFVRAHVLSYLNSLPAELSPVCDYHIVSFTCFVRCFSCGNFESFNHLVF